MTTLDWIVSKEPRGVTCPSFYPTDNIFTRCNAKVSHCFIKSIVVYYIDRPFAMINYLWLCGEIPFVHSRVIATIYNSLIASFLVSEDICGFSVTAVILY